MQFPNGALRLGRESLPSVDSAVDSWGELGDSSGTMPEILRLWDTASTDSGQLDLSIPSYLGYQLIKSHSRFFSTVTIHSCNVFFFLYIYKIQNTRTQQWFQQQVSTNSARIAS